jgi:8-oxo-dGTP pyrophosphatase MutT (NUDIX family)
VRLADSVATRIASVLPLPLRRTLYRTGFALMRVVWAVTRPSPHGVKVAVVRDGSEVLLVRHTYGPRTWDLPGGLIGSGEEPLEAARRELVEEVGLDGQLSELGRWDQTDPGRRGSLSGFAMAVTESVTVRIDPAEIAVARWWRLDELPADRTRNSSLLIGALRSAPTRGAQVEGESFS